MTFMRHAAIGLFAAWVFAATTFAGDLQTAYYAVLRGDYESGRTNLQQLLAGGQPSESVKTLDRWLDRYEEVTDARKNVKQQTVDWHRQQAQAALTDSKVYLALVLTARGALYGADEENPYLGEPWLHELITKAKAEADGHVSDYEWSKAAAYYLQLARLHEDDDEYEALLEDANRHARIELLYEDRDELERRVQGATFKLLQSVVRFVDRNYFETPDFRKLAIGALLNVESLLETAQLYDFLDGLANPASRRFFLSELEKFEQEVKSKPGFAYTDFMRLFKKIEVLNEHSVELPVGLLVVEFLEGATSELDDYTSVVWPVDSPDFDKLMLGGFEGVGIQLGKDELTHRLRVVTPLEDSPALEAGIQAGDLIIEVDGTSTKGWSTDDAVRNIMGPAGTTVNLTMFRPSTGKRIVFPVTRQRITLKTVRGIEREEEGRSSEWSYMLDEENGVAYIRLTQFLSDSPQEMEKALRAAQRNGMKGLVLDLRGNPGGFLHVAVEIVSMFIDRGELVVSTDGLSDPRQTYKTTTRARYRDLPLVVLVNEGSASASEIVSGAIQEHDRGLVLGERTFGKGMVQKIMELGTDARLKITTALYYLPSGRSPHKRDDAEVWGVDPDWRVALNPKEQMRIIELSREAYIIRSSEDEEDSVDAEREKVLEALSDELEDDEDTLLKADDFTLIESDPVKVADNDPQLETALLHLRVKLAADLPWPREMAARGVEVEP